MRSLFRLFWDICLLRTTPAQVPWSPALLLVVLLVSLLIDNLNLAISIPREGWAHVPLVVLVHSGFYYGSLALLLWLTGYRARIVQTLTALAGSGFILSLLAMPLLLLMSGMQSNTSLLALLLLILNLWSLLVMAHILRHALSVGFMLAGVLAFGYFVMSIKLVDMLLPSALTQVN
jgi:hypothetical protein